MGSRKNAKKPKQNSGGKFQQSSQKAKSIPPVKQQGQQSCPLKKKNKPCDISDLGLETETDDGSMSFSKFGTAGDQDPDDLMEMVADLETDREKKQVKAKVIKFATDRPDHPMLKVFRAGASPKVFKGGETAEAEVDVYMDPWTESGGGLPFNMLWNFRVSPVRYVFTASSCGVRTSGKAIGNCSLNVDAFPADQMSLEYEWQAIKNEHGSEGDKVYHRKEGWKDRKEEKEGDKGEEQEDDDKPSIKLKRNDQDVLEGESITELLSMTLWVAQILKGLVDLIEEGPKTGLTFSYEFKMWQGTMSLTWGWKNGEERRVYYGVGGETALTVVSFEMALGFGIDWKLLVLKIEIGVDEAKVDLSEAFEWKFRSAEKFENYLSAKVAIEADAKATASAGYGWCTYVREYGVKSGVEGDAGIIFKPDGVHFKAKLEWTGVEGYLKTGTPTTGESEEKHQWVKGCELIDKET